MPTISTAHMYPAPGTNDCRDCRWYGGIADKWGTSHCDKPNSARVNALPEYGCCSWAKREAVDPRPEPPAWISDQP